MFGSPDYCSLITTPPTVTGPTLLTMTGAAGYLLRRPGWTLQVDKCATLRPARVTHAAYRNHDGTMMFFANHLVARLKSKDEGSARPTVLILWWPALPKAGIHFIGAALPDPNQQQNHHIHVFSKDLYARFDEVKGVVVAGSCPISESWLALAEAGFRTVDAVLPYRNNVAIFFNGDRFAIVAFEFLEKGVSSNRIESGKFASRWPALSEFESIDYTLPEPENGRVVFFSVQKYISLGAELFCQHLSLSLSRPCSLCAQRSPHAPRTHDYQRPAVHSNNNGTFPKDSLPEDFAVATSGSISSQWPALTRIGFYPNNSNN
ncbi:hypothetical protein BDV93DRAFT_334408 [Ceratobasidium sp. AG-I]|nr:hypothetical protein BDV93DRAFT_334408 [Ceratobasidium sp. AG-I]